LNFISRSGRKRRERLKRRAETNSFMKKAGGKTTTELKATLFKRDNPFLLAALDTVRKERKKPPYQKMEKVGETN